MTHIKDSDTGLTYMQARYYDPAIGRFLLNDLLGFRDIHSFNRYSYAKNNPYKYRDPDGKAPLSDTQFLRSIGIDSEGIATFHKAHAKAGITVTKATPMGRGVTIAKAVLSLALSESGEGTRELGELEPIHEPDHPQNDSDIEELSDEDLEDAIKNPKNDEKVKVKGNKVMDGNTRISEAKKRDWPADTKIPKKNSLIQKLIHPDDPLGGYDR